MISLVRRALAYEIGMYRSLGRWVIRRPSVPDSGATRFGYSVLVAPVIWIFIFVSAVEVVAVDLLLPWESLRIAFLIVGIWGLVWMLGLLASVKVHPHLISDAGLRVRYSTNANILIPWEDIGDLQNRRRDLEKSKTVQIASTPSGTFMSVGVLKQTKIDIVLREPRSILLSKGASEPITEIRLYADDPKALLKRARELQAS